ncbi:MAG: hypothetical protein ACTSXL_04070 [Alphaproteobacteria bacterium]
MKKLILPLIALFVVGCQSLMNNATCYYFLRPGVSREVCNTILPVFKKHGLNDSKKIKDYANFVKNDLPKNKWKYAMLFATGMATGTTKTYLDTTKDSVIALADLASKQENPLKFTADAYSDAVELGKIFK